MNVKWAIGKSHNDRKGKKRVSSKRENVKRRMAS